FDMVKVNISSTGTVTLINKLTNAVFFTGSVSNFMEGILDTTKIPQPPVVVIISPPSPTVTTNGTVPFVASVFYTSNTQVTWSVVEGNAGGTINSAGVYTAPATAGGGPYHVKATSVADSTKSDTSTVTVNGLVGVTISPSPTTVTVNGTKNFSATVTGTSNTQVVWSVVEAGGGTISQSGVYTAPATVGTYHVKAVSLADPTKSSMVTVTVTPAPQPFPIGTWVGPNGSTFTIDNLVQTVNSKKYYSGTISYSSFTNGVISASGSVLPTGSGSSITGYTDSYGETTISVNGFDGDSIGGNVTSFYANLTKLDDSTLKGTLIIVASKVGASLTMANANFDKQ
ncbi:MAG: hypothetical protein NDI77_07910, partial [Geobacteraceae bacterium]|nr:hypothetical protein [Geobacteraceae bacterium]